MMARRIPTPRIDISTKVVTSVDLDELALQDILRDWARKNIADIHPDADIYVSLGGGCDGTVVEAGITITHNKVLDV